MVGGAISGYCATGKNEVGDGADDGDEGSDDRREDRPVDEEMRQAHGVALLSSAPIGAIVPGCGVTLLPGRARIRPLMMT